MAFATSFQSLDRIASPELLGNGGSGVNGITLSLKRPVPSAPCCSQVSPNQLTAPRLEHDIPDQGQLEVRGFGHRVEFHAVIHDAAACGREDAGLAQGSVGLSRIEDTGESGANPSD